MAQKGRQLQQASLGIDAFSIPAQQCPNGEGVTLIPSSELASQFHKLRSNERRARSSSVAPAGPHQRWNDVALRPYR